MIDNDCGICWWGIEQDADGGWRHVTDRAELSDGDWMCKEPAPAIVGAVSQPARALVSATSGSQPPSTEDPLTEEPHG